MMKRSIMWTTVMGLIVILALSACGDEGSQSGGPITLKHAKEDLTLSEPAKRIVVLEWTYAENLLALGVQPVGVADIAGMNQWVQIGAKLADSVVDVGVRNQPSLEQIIALNPDLIIGVEFRMTENYAQLKDIAPTLVFNPYPDEASGISQYEEMEQTFRTIAAAVGKSQEAEQVLAQLEANYAKYAQQIKAAGKEGMEIILTQAFSVNNVPTFRLFTDHSMAMVIMEKIGLKNAYKSPRFELYGFGTATVEALPAIQQASLIHMVQTTDNMFDVLSQNPVWSGLTFVKENRIHALGGETWPFGGPLSADVMAAKTAALLSP